MMGQTRLVVSSRGASYGLRPRRALVQKRRCQKPFFGSIRAHHANMEPSGLLLGEGDQITTGGPHRRAITPVSKGNTLRFASVCTHNIELLECPNDPIQKRFWLPSGLKDGAVSMAGVLVKRVFCPVAKSVR
ncbi:hypothetical protein GQR58_002115 [Nymphon striatum]|nr:hypothetical protein GQR58_002115 [Nymphon striatum]